MNAFKAIATSIATSKCCTATALVLACTSLASVSGLAPFMRHAAVAQTSPGTDSLPPDIENDLLDRPDFFEDGIDQLEDDIRDLENRQQQPAGTSPTLTIQDDLLQWKPTTIPEAGVGLWMPQGITTEESDLFESSDEALNFSVLSSQVASSRYVVGHTSLSPSQLQLDSQTLFQQFRDTIVDRTRLELQTDREIELDERYQGREFSLAGNGEQLTMRAYAIGDRLVVLAGEQPQRQQDSEAIDTFLDSLQLLQ